MSTDETAESLVERLATAGDWPEPHLLTAILERGSEAVEPLRALIRQEVVAGPARWTIAFAVDLLGSLGDPSVIPDIFDLFRRYVINEDELLEAAKEALRTFGPRVLEPALEITRDRTLPWYPQGMALDVAVGVAGDDLVARARIAEVLRAILADDLSKGAEALGDRRERVSWLVYYLSGLADPLARDLIDAAYQAGMVDAWLISPADVEQWYRNGGRRLTMDLEPWLPHYEKQYASEMERLRRQAEPEPEPKPMPSYQPSRPPPPAEEATPLPSPVATIRKTEWRPGRNDPCWCGSGKKYKQCHLRHDEAQKRG